MTSQSGSSPLVAPVSGQFAPVPSGDGAQSANGDGAQSGSAVHLFPVRIYYEDTDLSGIVYHANYLRYMERARSDMLRLAGIDQRDASESGEGHYAVADLQIKYRAPAKLDDDLVVISTVKEVRAASCVIHQVIMRGDVVLTEGGVTAAFITPQGRPRRQPADWVQRFQSIINGRIPSL